VVRELGSVRRKTVRFISAKTKVEYASEVVQYERTYLPSSSGVYPVRADVHGVTATMICISVECI